jgi:hypothetical protein
VSRLLKPVVVLPLIFGTAVAAYFLTEDSTSPVVTLDGGVWEVPRVVVDETYLTPITISNPSDDELEVVGLGNLCGENCCFKVDHPLRFPLRPRSSVRVPLSIHTYYDGPFHVEMSVYVRDRDGYRTLPVVASGHSVEKK